MQAEQVRVRPASAADLAAVAGILAFYVTNTVATFEEEPPGVPQWRQRLADLAERKLPFLVAEAGGTVAGYAYASPWRPKPAYRHTVEDSVYLAPGQRGRGLGRLLLEALLTGCADAGVRQVIAVIADSGDPASVALHRACGFADAGRLSQVGYKHGRWVDTVLLQRELQPGTTVAG
jgi:L-amino acid N-acyltransferase YncA